MPNENEALAALDLFLALSETGHFDRTESGEYEGWKYWRGKDRVAFLPKNGEFVYKIGLKMNDPNYCEDENMKYWIDEGFPWAPPTTLYRAKGKCILAMPYYPVVIESMDEIPDSAKEQSTDVRLENFIRGFDGIVMMIDAGDIHHH